MYQGGPQAGTGWLFLTAYRRGWAVQLLLNPPDYPSHSADVIPPACAETDRISDIATYWALGIGALAAVILFLLLRKAVMRVSLDPPQKPG
jgi:hypothetical protein